MTLNYNALHTKEVFFILILSSGFYSHVVIIPLILEAASRDGWLSVFAAFLASLLFIAAIYYIVSRTGQENIATWLREKFGKIATVAVMVPLMVILFVQTAVTLMHTMIWAEIYYLPDIPYPVVSAILTISSYWLSTRKLKELAIMSTIVLPLVIILGFFITGVNTTEKNMEYLFPLFLNGYKPFLKGIFYSLSGLTEIFVVILLQHSIKEKIKFKQIFFLTALLAGLTIGPLSAAIMEFGPVEARNFSFPSYEEWKLLKIGDFISRLDFLAMFQWLSGIFFRISLFMYLINHFIKKGKNKFSLPILYLMLYGISFLKVSIFDLDNFMYVYFIPVSLMIVFAVVCCLFLMVLINQKRSTG